MATMKTLGLKSGQGEGVINRQHIQAIHTIETALYGTKDIMKPSSKHKNAQHIENEC